MKSKIIRIAFIIGILFWINVAISHARIVTNDPVVNSGDTVTINVTSQESLDGYKVSISSNSGLTFVNVSGGDAVNGQTVTGVSSGGTTSLATYTFKAPEVSQDTTYKVVFASEGVILHGANEKTSGTQATATVTVKGKGGSSNNENNNNNNNNNNNEKEPSFTKTNDTVYSTGSVNVRKSYSTDSNVIGSLSDGEEVKREATGDNGWSRITYNGGIGYVKTSLLTTTKPEEDKSADKSLKSLKVKPEGLDPEFNPDTTIYSLTVGADVDKLEIEAVATDEKAKVDISGNEEFKDGENTVKITVTAEDGTARTYTINVTKAAKTDVALKSLKIKGYELSPAFDPNVFSYKVSVKDANVTKLDIEALGISDDYEVDIAGNENFKNGQNIVKITVKAKDSDNETIYKIYVNKTAETTGLVSAKDSNKKSKLPLYIGIGIIILLIIAIIVVIIRNRNDEDYYDEDEDEDDDDNNLYGYSSKNEKQVEDKTIMFNPNNNQENQLDKVEGNDNVDEEFDFNPYTKNGISTKPNDTSRAPSQDRDLFGTMNGVDESYKYVDNNKDDLSEALNNYKEQEKQENNTQSNNQDNAGSIQNNSNQEPFSGVNSFDYNSYLENSYGYDDDDRPKRSRGKHSK